MYVGRASAGAEAGPAPRALPVVVAAAAAGPAPSSVGSNASSDGGSGGGGGGSSSSSGGRVELLVFGYACKLFRDDEKALQQEQGRHLIPWMGDASIMIDSRMARDRA